MAYTSKLSLLATLLLLLLLALGATFSAARPGLAPSIPTAGGSKGLAARLKLDGESSSCWDSLVELQACTGEVILFFLDGETYLGPSCCRAIRIIGQQCWPAMFGSIGFTAEEADVLQGFCEGLAEAHPFPPPPSQPPTRAVFVGN